ncbi:hypothetical protein F7R12_12995 [Pseudomonas tolaasii]|nr:hypothetical protein F7R12_12995 [Pseudomonas tolaasii]
MVIATWCALARRSRATRNTANVGAGFCGSWLACDAGTSVYQVDQGDAIAGKPAPTWTASTVGPITFKK